MDKTVIAIPSAIPMVTLTGPADTFLAEFERAFPELGLTVRGNEFLVRGPEQIIAEFRSLISELLVVIRSGQVLTTDAVVRSIAMVRGNSGERPGEVLSLNILSNRGKTIRPKTANQKKYVDAIDQKTVTFGIGPAGTGKTYLAVAKAVQALQAKTVNRISGSRGATGFPSRNFAREDRSIPSTTLRLASRHGRYRFHSKVDGQWHDRSGSTRLHAWQDPQ
jgi:phosphate starvation-inducible PhoH-like protein